MKTKARLIATVKIWIVIYPALTIFLYLVHDKISHLPLYLRTFLMTATLVPLIVFIGIPTVDRIIGIFKNKTESGAQ